MASSESMMNGGATSSESIPFDLIIEILTRLPAKSIARFRCVSKLWSATFNTPNFTKSFFAISLSRPKLLFSVPQNGETFFFTSPQPQNSSQLTPNLHMSFPIIFYSKFVRPVRGMLCGVSKRVSMGRDIYVPFICNPSTGQFLALPEVEKSLRVPKVCLGYDPIDKQYKVLLITVSYSYDAPGYGYYLKHRVLTLGTEEKPSWRIIRCDITNYPHPLIMDYRDLNCAYDDLCINGVCYYSSRAHRNDEGIRVISSFDIRSEKFKSIREAFGMKFKTTSNFQPTLVNYQGKLAKLLLNYADGIRRGIQLWVLKDAEKHEWLNNIYDFPPPWNDKLAKEALYLYFVGTTGTSEIVLSSNNRHDSFGLLYYNTERNSITRVGIQGMEAYRTGAIYTFLDYVEDLKLMGSI